MANLLEFSLIVRVWCIVKSILDEIKSEFHYFFFLFRLLSIFITIKKVSELQLMSLATSAHFCFFRFLISDEDIVVTNIFYTVLVDFVENLCVS